MKCPPCHDILRGGLKKRSLKPKTLLKLTIPRIKLLRNRREIQLKQMRKEIAKLLETGQEATARIRVEHIIREEKMMAAQEIIELFCELISVRLPIIEAQRECPLDLKEAISSICFAAPRCADLPELLQVQLAFTGKYGKEFVAAATELRPECGVNRQLIELLSIRAPAPDVKLKVLKEIAEEHELEWDPSASETELLKHHEDLLNGPTQLVSGSKVPLPEEKHDSASEVLDKPSDDSDGEYDILDFPEVPRQPLHSNTAAASTPEMLPFPASALSDFDHEVEKSSEVNGLASNKPEMEHEEVLVERSAANEHKLTDLSPAPNEEKQFLPFMAPPPKSSSSVKQSDLPPPLPKTLSETNIDLQDVLAAAQAAAETAERAAAAARSAASLAQLRISELTKKKDDAGKGPFHVDAQKDDSSEKPHLEHESSFSSSDAASISESPKLNDQSRHHQPQRLPSIDDETYFSYPNLFTRQGSNLSSNAQSFNSRPPHEQ
nr:IST1 homolog [Ipomoea batatas]GME20549.1 IST1 homolog [Ipomoea batatas]